MAGIRDIATLGFRADARELVNADRTLNNLANTGQRTERQADRVNSAMTRMASAARALAGALALREYVRLADAWTNMNGRLSLVTDSTTQLVAVQGKLYDMSQRTFSQLGETTDLYTKITRATAELNKTDNERLRLTETINKATIVSGASAASAAAGLQQLGQGLGSGVVRGEEFNSVMENTPRLAEALAAGLGKTRAELRAMAEQGKLTTDVVLGALESQASVIDAEFARMPTTVGNAMTQVQNAILRTIGVFDTQNKVSGTMASGLTAVAMNAEAVAKALALVAAAGAARWIAGYITGIRAKIIATNAATVADRAAMMQSHATGVAAARAALNTANAQLVQAQATMAAATGMARLTVQQTVLAPAQARVIALTGIYTRALAGQAAAATAATLASRVAAGAMAIMGGPLGLILTALTLGATAWAMWGNKAEEAATEAEETLTQKTDGIIKQLDKQIEKLEYRNKLAAVEPKLGKDDPYTDQQRDVLKEIERVGKDDTMNLTLKVETLKRLGLQYNDLTVKIERLGKAQAIADAEKQGDARTAFYEKNTQYLTDAEKLTRALAEARKDLGAAFTPADEARIRGAFSKKEDNQAAKDAASKAAAQLEAARDAIKSLKNEREELGLTDAQLVMLNAARAAAVAPTRELKQAIIEEAVALNEARAATEAAATEKTRYTEAVNAQVDARLAESLSAQAAVDAAQREIDTYGMGAAAITRYTIAKMEANKAGIMATGSYSQNEIDHLDALIGKQRELMGLQNMRGDLDDLLNVDKVETFGEALRGAFGEAGSALGQLGGQFQSYMEKMTAAEKKRAVVKLKYAGDEKRTTREIAKIDEQAERDRIGAYADIAGAAKGMFKEQTAGYKILQAVEQTFRAVELAGQMESLYKHLFVTATKAAGTEAGQALETAAVIGGEAERNVAKVPGVQMAFMSALGPWGMAAAGVAIAAVLGGAFGSSSSVNAADRADAVQKKQGTGGVFGDSDAKADSMAKSLELLEANSDMVLPLTQNMVASLQSIDASMSGLSNLVVRTAGITTGDNFGIATGVTGAALGGLWGKTKQSITDSGIQFGGSVADLQNGQGYQQYANVEKTKSSFFGLKKSSSNSLTTGALDGDLTAQFALVFKDLEKVLASSAPALGKDADAISAAVRGVQLDMTKLSLMDLKGDELQAAINAVISKASDDVAQVALPGFDAFRKVGEGYATTVMRVATGIERADYELERFGITAVAYSDILNKQGDVGAEIVRQSIMAAAGMGGVADIMRTMSGSATDLAATYGDLLTAQDAMRMVGFAADGLGVTLVRSAGGLDKLQSGLDDYLDGFFTDSEKVAAQTASMGRKFADLGLTMPATSDAFRALVENTPALRGQLLLLAGGFAELMESTVDLAKTIDTRGMLVDVMRAEGRVAESVALSRTLELEETEKLLHPMQQRLWALEDERAAAELNVRLLEAQGDTAGALALSRSLELSAMLDSERGIQQRIWALEDERAALDKALTAVQRAVEDERKAKTTANKTVMDGYDKSIERSKKAVASLKTVTDMLADAVEKVGLPTEAQDAAGNRRNAQSDLATMAALFRTGGVLPDTDKLTKVLATLAEDSSAQFGSEAEYKLDRIKTATAVADLAGATGKALTIEERNLASLERMRTAAQDAHAADMVRLDGILETAQRQVEATKGVDVSVMSVSAAVAALGTLLGKVSQGGASAAIVGAYGSALGRAPDAAGMDYWSGLAAGGVSMDAISGSIRGSTEAQEKIAALYEKVLGRPADKAGADYWKGTGLSLADIEKSLRASDEYMKLPASASTDSDSNWRKGDTPAAATAYAATTAPSSNSNASNADNQAVVEALGEHGKLMIQLLYPIAKSTKETAKTNAAMNRTQQQQEVAPT